MSGGNVAEAEDEIAIQAEAERLARTLDVSVDRARRALQNLIDKGLVELRKRIG